MLGCNIGDLCCEEPWTSKKVNKSLNELGNIESVKFFHSDPSKILPIVKNTNIKTTYLHLSNDEMCTTRSWKQWVSRNVKPIANRFKGKLYLVVGNEVLAPHNKEKYVTKLLPALRGCHRALNDIGLGRVKVITPLDTSCLQCSYPPSSSTFKPELVPILKQIVQFMVNTNSKIAFNIYPFFAREQNEEFALFGDDKGYTDKGRKYENLFDAQYDAVIHAVSKISVRNANRTELIVTETGWPSEGASMASNTNTSRFVEGIRRSCAQGTPLRRGPKEILLFELYDENLKEGSPTEKHFGVFHHDGSLKT